MSPTEMKFRLYLTAALCSAIQEPENQESVKAWLGDAEALITAEEAVPENSMAESDILDELEHQEYDEEEEDIDFDEEEPTTTNGQVEMEIEDEEDDDLDLDLDLDFD